MNGDLTNAKSVTDLNDNVMAIRNVSTFNYPKMRDQSIREPTNVVSNSIPPGYKYPKCANMNLNNVLEAKNSNSGNSKKSSIICIITSLENSIVPTAPKISDHPTERNETTNYPIMSYNQMKMEAPNYPMIPYDSMKGHTIDYPVVLYEYKRMLEISDHVHAVSEAMEYKTELKLIPELSRKYHVKCLNQRYVFTKIIKHIIRRDWMMELYRKILFQMS